LHRVSNVGNIQGAGLGLAIVKNSVEPYGRQVAIRSRPGPDFFYSAYLSYGGTMAHVLIIEDETQIRDNLVRFLRLEGHAVDSASDGLAGLTAIRHKLPQLIICDFMMPRMNGFQVLEALRADAELKTVPFIMLSASAEPERLQQAIALGARAYVTKPFQLEQLRLLLARHLASS
jgi:CheY-like chemotaxis protein